MDTSIQKVNTISIGKDLLLAFFHSFLLLPIVSLFVELNNIDRHGLLILFFLFSQIIALFFKKWWVFFPVQSALMLYILYQFFPPANLEANVRDWMIETWTTGIQEWQELISQELTGFPSLLGILGILLLVCLLTYATIRLKKPIIAFLVSFIYLIILHTFTSNVILPYMIQVLGFGFLLISLAQIDTNVSWFHFVKATVVISLCTTLLVVSSYWGVEQFQPTQEWIETRSYAYQQELDSRGFFDWINLNTSGRGFSRMGFSTNDDILGGPLQRDFTPLFIAYSSRPQYWKVMHRDIYTGLGWESEFEEYRSISLPYSPLFGNVSIAAQEEMDEMEIQTISHIWDSGVSYIAYPYSWIGLEFPNEDELDDFSLTVETYSDYYTLHAENTVEGYTLAYETNGLNRLDETMLRQDDGWRQDWLEQRMQWEDTESQGVTEAEWLQEVFSAELYLPENLPDRVSELAHEITDDLDSEYEKVRAIETYLKESGGFRYSLRETANTPTGEDYVDYFLFETQVGYCDNFSTAMAVMLRSIGIPSRWAKGFTPGSQQIDENGEEYFQVSNSNAHSWTEVFFPSHGWVPFEPSPSFSQPATHPEAYGTIGSQTYSFEEDEGLLDATDAETDLDSEEETVEEDEEQVEDEQEETEDALEDDENDGTIVQVSTNENQLRLWFFAFIAITMSLILYFIYSSTQFIMLPAKWLVKSNKLSLNRACSLVLRLYEIKRNRVTGQTIQQFFDYWKPFASRHEKLFDRFADLTNTAFYGPDEIKEKLTSDQKEIILEMLNAYKDVPRSARENRQKQRKSARTF